MTKVYTNLTFPKLKNRPYFVANFVTTLDGKIQVLTNTKDYWPLGSELDYETLIDLRSYADALIHGKTTALGHPTTESITKKEFRKLRKNRGKSETLPYFVVSNHPGLELIEKFQHSLQKPVLLTSFEAYTHESRLKKIFDVIPLGKDRVELNLLSDWLHQKGYETILVEGGPHLFASFLNAHLIDELFLTVAPKIIGNLPNQTLTLVEGNLFPAEKVKTLKLISSQVVENEIYLRYKSDPQN